jgi:hypothetical protein
VHVSDGQLKDECSLTVTVIDATPPAASCDPGVHPAGNEPQANNQDGFFTIGGSDNCNGLEIFVIDEASDEMFGPYPSGTNIKYVQAPGAKSSAKPGSGEVDWNVKGKVDAYVLVVDDAGNESKKAYCRVPTPPSHRLCALA